MFVSYISNYVMFLNWMRVCVVKPSTHELNNKRDILQDLTVLTGGQVGIFSNFPSSFFHFDVIRKLVFLTLFFRL